MSISSEFVTPVKGTQLGRGFRCSTPVIVKVVDDYKLCVKKKDYVARTFEDITSSNKHTVDINYDDID